jgi:hypothetical protein
MKGVRFAAPAAYSTEIEQFYDLVYDGEIFCASWCGSGHYYYGEPDKIAKNQDGHIYLWPHDHSINGVPWVRWHMSANPKYANDYCPAGFVTINTFEGSRPLSNYDKYEAEND